MLYDVLKVCGPQCLLRAEGAVINHYAGDFGMFICSKEVSESKVRKYGQMKSREEKSRREEEKELEENRYGCAKF